MVAGDVVNTAARLQSAAPVDGILVGEQTFRATERTIVYRETSPIEAKGKAKPVPVWEALEARSRFGVDLGSEGRAPLVGRDRELDLLVDALRRARDDRSTQLVTLVGVPGMGKSRLVYELARVVDEDEELITWRQGRSLPYGEGVSYWALGEIVKAQAGVLESDSAEVTSEKLADAVTVVSDESERAWVGRRLRPLVGLGGDEDSGGRRGEAFAAWRRFLEAVAETGPAVLVFEDLHWGDDGLLDFVDGLVDWVDGVAMLVVCTARPELLDRRPDWGGGKRNATTISLAPLTDEASARLVLALLDRPLLDAEMQRQLVERCAGNPLYAEEFVRMQEAGGRIDERLPETVHGIVAARIDLLPPEEKQLLQQAAVLGKIFWSDAIASLSGLEGWEAQESLRSLERKEFIRREHRSAVAGASQYAFQHALVRDAAYGQLPRSARARLHVAVADWIESLPEDRAEDRAETLAHHYLTAIELRRAAGEASQDIAPRAAHALREAGERSLALGSFASATQFLSHALDLVPTGERVSPELLFAVGRAFAYSGRQGDELERAVEAFEEEGSLERAAEAAVELAHHGWRAAGAAGAQPWIDRASALLEGRPPSRAKAVAFAERARFAMFSYQYDSAIDLSDRALAMAAEPADVELRADVLVTKGACLANMGLASEGVSMIREALEMTGGRGRVGSRGHNNLAVALGSLGDRVAAASVLEDEILRAEREGDEGGVWFTRGNLLDYHYGAGEWNEALDLADLILSAPPSFRYMAGYALMTRASVLAARGAWAEALDAATESVAHARGLGDSQVLVPSLVTVSRLTRRHGAHDNGALAEALRVLGASEAVGDPQDWHVELVLELDADDRVDVARDLTERLPDVPWRDACRQVVDRDYEAAADLLESLTRPLEADVRLLAARSLVSAGRLVDAEAQLERARTFWRRVGATAYLREADEVLAEAG
jgi:tetratricopeptide (TPR) repeat protein